MRCTAIILTLLVASSASGLSFIGPPTTQMQAGQIALGGRYGWSEQDVLVEGVPVNDFKWDTFLAELRAGLASDRVELFGLIGTSEMELSSVDGDHELALGGGARITTNLGEALSWGIAGQILWWEEDASASKLDLLDMQVVLGPCYRAGGLVLYGGPMFHYISGELDILDVEFDIKEDANFGGYIGGGFEVVDRLDIVGEFQATPDATGVGIAVTWTF